MVTGTSFGVSGFVTIGGISCLSSGGVVNNVQITCAVPAGNGLNNPLVVTVAGQTSNTFVFNYKPPSISSISPTNGLTSGAFVFFFFFYLFKSAEPFHPVMMC